MESSCCIQFLIKLLKPVTSAASEEKLPKIGSKLLRVKNDSEVTRGTSSKLDCTSVSIITKVKEILGSCKELKPNFGDDYVLGRPESSPKWIALLITEKTSVSTISLEGNMAKKSCLRIVCLNMWVFLIHEIPRGNLLFFGKINCIILIVMRGLS